MRYEIDLPRRSLPTAVALGALVGAIFLGVGGRVAMRVFALLEGREPGWSFGGSMTVVFMGAVWGTLGGVLLWMGRRYFRRSPAARGALFWIPLTLLYLRGLSPLNANSLAAFMPIFVAYGAVLYRVFCHRYVARWATSMAAGTA
jgi:hypothetical protein